MSYKSDTAIATMLSGFRQSSIDIESQVNAFLIAADGYREDAIIEAAMRFIRGKVKGHKPEFPPTSAQFGVECSSIHDQFEARDERAKTPRLSLHPEPIFTDEHRKKMQKKMATLSLALKGDERAKKKLGMQN